MDGDGTLSERFEMSLSSRVGGGGWVFGGRREDAVVKKVESRISNLSFLSSVVCC